jgi:hypothetical protein
VGLDLPGKPDQTVGLAGHGRHDHNNLVATKFPLGDAAGHVFDPLRAADGSATVLLND